MPNVFDATRNPKQQQFLNQILLATIDPTFRYLFYGGAVRGGKTSVCIVGLNLLAKKYPGSRWHIIRESMSTHEETTIPSYEKFTPTGSGMVKRYNRSTSNYFCEFTNGSKIFFASENLRQDPDLDWMKGLETNGILLEQMEELSVKTYNKALERTGSWYIDPMPPGLILGTFNPTQNWVKETIREKARRNELKAPFYFLEALPKDNPFVTDEQWQAWENMDENSYRRFIEGDWTAFDVDKPFMYSFTMDHVQACELNPDKTVYLSFDFNVDPIVCLVIQYDLDWINFLDEYRLPNSDLYELCAQIKGKYGSYHKRITGDASGLARTVTTKGNVNNYTIIRDELGLRNNQIDLPRRNPPIDESRTLSNAIWNKHKDVKVDPKCKYFIEDCRFVQVRDDGSIDKRDGERSHLLDAGRYFFNMYKHSFIVKGY